MDTKTALHARLSVPATSTAGPGAATSTAGPGARVALFWVPLLVLILGASSAAVVECPDDLPLHDGSEFSLSILCSPTQLQPTITTTDIDNFYYVNSYVSCTFNGSQLNATFLQNSLISEPEEVKTINHSYPVGTVCHVTGCYTSLLYNPLKKLQNASCIISLPAASPTMSTPTVPSSSSPLSPSTSHHPLPYISSYSLSSLPSQLHNSTKMSSSPSLSPSSTSVPRETVNNKSMSPLLTAVVVCVAVLPSLTLLCVLLLIVSWYRSQTHRKIRIKVGANNWRSEDVDIDYSPVDLCKPLAPAFSSYESLIHNLYTPDPTSHSSLPPAPLPLTTHPAQDPTTGTTPQHNKHTHQGSFLHEPPLVREDGERGEGKSGLTCETVGLREEILSGGDVGSSSNTSGYSTGCNDSDNQHHESTGAVEMHSKLQPENGRQHSESDRPTSSSVSHNSESKCEEVKTAELERDLTEIDRANSHDIPETNNHQHLMLLQPSLADEGNDGCASSTRRNTDSCTTSVASTSTPNGLSASPLATNCSESRPTAAEHRERETETKAAVANDASAHTLIFIQDTTKNTTNPQSLSQEQASQDATTVKTTFETDIPPTPTTSEQQRATLLFSYLQKASSSLPNHQSASSPGNGSGSLVDYAGYLHIQGSF